MSYPSFQQHAPLISQLLQYVHLDPEDSYLQVEHSLNFLALTNILLLAETAGPPVLFRRESSTATYVRGKKSVNVTFPQIDPELFRASLGDRIALVFSAFEKPKEFKALLGRDIVYNEFSCRVGFRTEMLRYLEKNLPEWKILGLYMAIFTAVALDQKDPEFTYFNADQHEKDYYVFLVEFFLKVANKSARGGF